jgi:hypothetical protein
MELSSLLETAPKLPRLADIIENRFINNRYIVRSFCNR